MAQTTRALRALRVPAGRRTPGQIIGYRKNGAPIRLQAGGAGPAIVQHASTTHQFTSGTTGTVAATFGSETTEGNCLVACFTITDTEVLATGIGVTTNGEAENWAAAASKANADFPQTYIYVDPGTGGGQTVIDVALTFGFTASTSDTVGVLVDIFEVSGVAATSPVDKTNSGASDSGVTSWSSGASGETSDASEIAFGACGFQVTDTNTTQTVTPPASAWTNETLLDTTVQLGGTGTGDRYYMYQQSGYQVLAAEASVTWSGTNSSDASYYTACIVTLTAAAGSTVTASAAQTLTPDQTATAEVTTVVSVSAAQTLTPSQAAAAQVSGTVTASAAQVITPSQAAAAEVAGTVTAEAAQTLTPSQAATASATAAYVAGVAGAVSRPLTYPQAGSPGPQTASAAQVITPSQAAAAEVAGTVTAEAAQTLTPSQTAEAAVTGLVSASASQTITPGQTAAAEVRSPGGETQFLAIPLYSYPPSPFWSDAIAAAPTTAIIVANVDSGPGTGYEANFGAVYAQAAAAGITVIGYVSTDYGAASQASVEAQIDDWYSFYGDSIGGILFDEVTATSEYESYYTALADYVHSNHSGSIAVLNPGDIPDASYLSVPIGDVVIVCEDSYANFAADAAAAPSWLFNYPASRIGVTCNNCATQADMEAAVALSSSAFNAKYVWVTADGDYVGEPSYFAAEVALLAGGGPSGELTVTATQGGDTSPGTLLRILVLDGATVAGTPNVATQSAAEEHQAAITTTEAGSVVVGAVVNGYSGEEMPADDGTTFLDNVLDTGNGLNYATIQNAATETPGAETVGTDASYGGGIALLEVLPSGGTIAVDASSPDVADTTSGTAVTSPSFTPPTGTLLVALATAGGLDGDVTTLEVSDSYGLDWIQAAVANAASQYLAGVWYAFAPADLAITTSSLPDGSQGVPYSQTAVASGGYAAYTWSVSSGTLPDGLSLNPSSGAITGTPTATGISDFTLKVTDSFGNAATQALSIDVSGSGPPPSGVTVVNQWAGGTFQPDTFVSMPAGAGSVVVALDETTSVGGGTGVPAEGNWLFALVGWNAAAQDAVPGDTPASVIPAITISVGDDSRMWWRPMPPSPSAPAPGTALCRTAIWYQPSIVPPARVYVAPTGFCTGMSVLVVEVAGLGPWDQVTSPANGSYSAPVIPESSLPLSVPAPSAESFMIAAVTGTLASAGTAVSGSGWTALQTVTTVNGTDDSSDTVLAACYITTSGAGDAAGTCTETEMMSGQILAVAVTGPTPALSPNPWWPTLVFEAAFGAGYWTPPDQMTWTSLQDSVNGFRLRSWSEETGPQYELDELEASEIDLVMDNPDGWLSPFNAESPFFPSVVPGTPVRIRAIPPAGTGGYGGAYASAVNRWYVWQRNMERWPQAWDSALRGIVNGTATDCWSVVNKTLPTCYRAEILDDLPYAWWPCDDSGANNATTLVNAAPGNNNPLTIGTLNGPAASIDNFPFTSDVIYSAVTAFDQSTGWMFGDPDSAAFGQSGNGNTDYGYYLYCHDEDFPQLYAPGVTVEAWFNADVYDADGTAVQVQGLYGQPDGGIIIWQIATSIDDAPATARLYLSAAGELIFGTFDGEAATDTTLIDSDLRDGSWYGVTVSMVVTGEGAGQWTVVVNGGEGGVYSGTAQMNTGFEWFYAMGSGGIGNTAQAGCGNFQVSHLAVFPLYLPAARVMAHHMAAYTGFGQLPCPVITTEFVTNPAADAYDPNGTQRTGTAFNVPGSGDSSLACVATAVCGDAYSGPSYPVQQLTVLPTSSPPGFCWASAGEGDSSQGSFAAPGYAWYTASSNGSMKLASSGLPSWAYVNGYGDGAAPPAAASAIGDTAQARVERLLQAGLATGPRCIDASQTAILAALDTGGQPCGDNIQNIAQSDSALLFVDNLNYLSYWDREHLEPASAEPQVSILAPVYSYPPGDFWTAAAAAAPTVQYVVANVDSGPGSEPEENFAIVFATCQAAGITLLGYVWTGYGSVSQASIEEQIGQWAEFYGITSILFDGVSSSADDLSYYQAIGDYARLHGASSVVLDCGTIPDQSYMGLSDVVVIFEGTAASFAAFTPPTWAADYPASQLGAVIYGAEGEDTMVSLVAQLQADNIGVTFITDASDLPAAFVSVPGMAQPGQATPGSPQTTTSGSGNPYDVLPTYWDDEVSVLAATAPQSASATWVLGPNVAQGQIPFELPTDGGWDTDPQRVLNDIEVTQYDTTEAGAEAQAGLSTGSAETSGGLVYAPAAQYYPDVLASQLQYGDCQYQITSYLQSTDEIQSQCNWLFGNYGVARQRITGLTVDASAKARTCPMAWIFVLGANVGDIVSATQSMPGQPPFAGLWRITHLSRKLDFANGTASCTVTADYLPPTYWS